MSEAIANPGRYDVCDVLREHRAFVSRILLRAGVALRDVADAEQEVFLVVQRRLAEFEGRARITTWLCRIALYVASDYRRRAHRRYEVLDGGTLESHDLLSDPQRAVEQQETFRLALEALDRLPSDKRDVFLLYELEELSMSEIARRVGVPLKTAFSRLYAARRELRLSLQRDGVSMGLWPLFWPRRTWHVWFEGARASLPTLPLLAVASGSVLCCFLAVVPSNGPPAHRSEPLRAQPTAARTNSLPVAVWRATGAFAPVPAPSLAVAGPVHAHRRAVVRPKTLAPIAVAAAAPQADAELELQVYRVGAVDVAPPRVLPFGFDEVEPAATRSTSCLESISR